MNDKANGNTSIGKIVLIGIVGVAIGFVAGKFIFPSLFFVTVHKMGAKASAKKTALIALVDNGGTCVFTDGNNVPYKYPVIKPNHGTPGNGDTITWIVLDGRPNHSGSLSFDLNFPPGAGTPFANNHFDNGHNNSGETNANMGDYPYFSVIAHTPDSGDVPCKNPGDPGIHVDN
jgi:hypothetical protein